MADNDPNDHWAYAIHQLTGYPMPDRGGIFDKLKGNNDIPLMKVEIHDSTETPSNQELEAINEMGKWRAANSGWRIENTDFVVPFYHGDDTSKGSSVQMRKARITLLGTSGQDVPHGGVEMGGTFTDHSNSGLMGSDFKGWDSAPLARYSFGGGMALEALMYEPYSTWGFSWNGSTPVADAEAVDLTGFERVALAFDRAAMFFSYANTTIQGWQDSVGQNEDAAWKGQAAGVFWDIVKQLGNMYQGYSNTLPLYGLSSKAGLELRMAKKGIDNALSDFHSVWSNWALWLGNPLRWLHDILIDVTNFIWDNNITKVRTEFDYSGDSSYEWNEIEYPDFRQDAVNYKGESFGDLNSLDTWKAIGQNAVDRWTGSVQSRLEPAGIKALRDVHNAWIDLSTTIGKLTTPSINLQADLQQDKADAAQAKADKQHADDLKHQHDMEEEAKKQHEEDLKHQHEMEVKAEQERQEDKEHQKQMEDEARKQREADLQHQRDMEKKAEQEREEDKRHQQEQEKKQEDLQKEQEKKQEEQQKKQEEEQKKQQDEARRQYEQQRKDQEEQQKKQEDLQKHQEDEARRQYQEQTAMQINLQKQQEKKQEEQEKKQEELQKRQEQKQEEQQRKQEEEQKKQQDEARKQYEEQRHDQQEQQKRQEEEQRRQEEQAQKQYQEQQKTQAEYQKQQQEEQRRQEEQAKKQYDQQRKDQQDQEQKQEKLQKQQQDQQERQYNQQQQQQQEQYKQQQQQYEHQQQQYEHQFPSGNYANNQVGSQTHVNPDGSVTTDYSDGSSTTYNPHTGVETTTHPNGSVTTDHVGSGHSFHNPDGSTTTVNGDGTLTTHYPDGSTTTVNPHTGQATTHEPDGRTTTTNLQNGRNLPHVPYGGGGSQYEHELQDPEYNGSLGSASQQNVQAPPPGSAISSSGNYLPPGTKIDGTTSGGMPQGGGGGMGGMPMGGMGGMGGGAGEKNANAERVRQVYEDDDIVTNDGGSLGRRSRRPTSSQTPANRRASTVAGYDPNEGAAGSAQTESGDRERESWAPEEEDVWGTDEGGSPSVIG
ncbi:AAWKG family protein [Actinoallomurus sp. NPDC050550]|uniref:AAWKG family protein n=1 Tax=Actinoallomurus sp. NPDC050550 TaxID=3154937 RepID=UPI0033E103B4